MKFCKDCKHYEAGVSSHGGSLLPGFAFYIPAKCHADKTPVSVDLVTGETRGGIPNDCSLVRLSELKCGQSGRLFEPATLDGRLAALGDKQ
jgi:hypothetical protein